MEILGIDRLVIGVRDLDRGMSLFRGVFGAKLDEIVGGAADAAGVRLAIDWKNHVELLSPVAPKDMNPPDPVTLARWLEERGDALFYALVLRVKDLDEALRELAAQGIQPVGNRIEMDVVEPYGFRNFKEVCLSEDDTLGLKLALVSYDEPGSES